MPPPAPQPKGFAVFWVDDRPVLEVEKVTGSGWSDQGLLVLTHSSGAEYLVNMDHVRWIQIWDMP